MRKKVPYIIITPARDEDEYIEHTIKSVISQTIQPVQWIIVDDGSTDNTGKIIDYYATKYPWIIADHRGNRGFRSAGVGVIEAFYDGYLHVCNEDWRYIVKLDGDLQFDADYFEKCFDKFDKNPKLGIGGGDIYVRRNGELLREKNPIFHVRGATKIYKNECWSKLGGLINAPGWDTIDEIKANQLGFETRTFTDITIIQLKSTGSAYGNWANWIKNGRADYMSCYHPIFMLLKCAKRLFQKPVMIAAFGLFWGFFSGYILRIDQIADKQLKKYIRQEQIKKITFRQTIWK